MRGVMGPAERGAGVRVGAFWQNCSAHETQAPWFARGLVLL